MYTVTQFFGLVFPTMRGIKQFLWCCQKKRENNKYKRNVIVVIVLRWWAGNGAYQVVVRPGPIKWPAGNRNAKVPFLRLPASPPIESPHPAGAYIYEFRLLSHLAVFSEQSSSAVVLEKKVKTKLEPCPSQWRRKHPRNPMVRQPKQMDPPSMASWRHWRDPDMCLVGSRRSLIPFAIRRNHSVSPFMMSHLRLFLYVEEWSVLLVRYIFLYIFFLSSIYYNVWVFSRNPLHRNYMAWSCT